MINKENVYSYYDQTNVARTNIVLLLFDLTNKFCSNLQYSLSIRSKIIFEFPKYVEKIKKALIALHSLLQTL